jgi:hypothetical protein
MYRLRFRFLATRWYVRRRTTASAILAADRSRNGGALLRRTTDMDESESLTELAKGNAVTPRRIMRS